MFELAGHLPRNKLPISLLENTTGRRALNLRVKIQIWKELGFTGTVYWKRILLETEECRIILEKLKKSFLKGFD